MTAVGPRQVVAFVTHARRVGAAEREEFGHRVRNRIPGHGLILSTCHRVEAYLADPADAAGLERLLPAGGRVLEGEAAVRHVISVAVGRDSVVLGEDQVLHQLREAVGSAAAGGLDPMLDRLFATALRTGRRARSWRQGPVSSLADSAIAAIQAQAGSLEGRQLLIVGAGTMGRLAARSAVAAGSRVLIASRSPARAEALAAGVRGRAIAFDPGPSIGEAAGIIVALHGRWKLGSKTIRAVTGSKAIVVDLSVPPAVPDPLAAVLRDRFVSADDLARADGAESAESRRLATRLDGLVESAVEEFQTWSNGKERRAAAEALTERADREREAELAALWRRYPELDRDARAAIEGMSRHLAARLLREPLSRLGRDRDGRHERAVRDLFGL